MYDAIERGKDSAVFRGKYKRGRKRWERFNRAITIPLLSLLRIVHPLVGTPSTAAVAAFALGAPPLLLTS